MKRTKRKVYIREWRKHRGLSLVQLAERIGTSHSVLSRIETGTQPYKQPLLEAIADALQCSPADLLMRDPSDPDGIWSVWENLSAPEKREAVAVIQAIRGTRRTGTND